MRTDAHALLIESAPPSRTVGAAGGAFLVIGFGCELRSDDGVGPLVAEAVERMALPGVRVVTCHQLTPEMALELENVDAVVFVDARLETTDRAGEDAAGGAWTGHRFGPEMLLELARELSGRSPASWVVGVSVREFGMNVGLTAEGRARAEEAVEIVRDLWRTWILSRGIEASCMKQG